MTDTSPSMNFAAVVVSDDPADNFARRPRSIYVGNGGTIQAVSGDGSVVEFLNIPDGVRLDIRPLRINDTDTTATDMVALF
jgi:hypothetical protein